MAVQVTQLNLDCHECDDVLKRERGCSDIGILPFRLDNELYFKCPIKLITEVSWEYIKAYSLYKRNILPHGNGWLNESQKFIDAMITIDNTVNKIQQEDLKEKPHG